MSFPDARGRVARNTEELKFQDVLPISKGRMAYQKILSANEESIGLVTLRASDEEKRFYVLVQNLGIASFPNFSSLFMWDDSPTEMATVSTMMINSSYIEKIARVNCSDFVEIDIPQCALAILSKRIEDQGFANGLIIASPEFTLPILFSKKFHK